MIISDHNTDQSRPRSAAQRFNAAARNLLITLVLAYCLSLLGTTLAKAENTGSNGGIALNGPVASNQVYPELTYYLDDE